MTPEIILTKLTAIFRDIFDDDGIDLTRDTTADDIEEWDSLNQIKLILACEEAFNLRLKPREINTLQDIGSMVDHIHDLLN